MKKGILWIGQKHQSHSTARSRLLEQDDPYGDVLREQIRQVRLSFNLIAVLTIVGSVIAVVSIFFFLSERISEGTLTTVLGLTSNIINASYFRLWERTNDKLDEMVSVQRH